MTVTILGERVHATRPDGADGAGWLDVLLIEDNPVDAAMVRALLAEELGAALCCVWARTLAEGRAALQKSRHSCVLLDLGLPDSDGLATLDDVIAVVPDTAIVVFTGLDDDRAGWEAVAHGAQDYLVKGKTDGALLVRAIRYAVDRKQAETARRSSEDRFRLAIESMVDPVFITSSVRDQAGEIVDFTFDYANAVACEQLGLTPEEVVGRTLLDVAPAQSELRLAAYRRLIETGEPFTGRQRYEGPLPGRGEVSRVMDLSVVRFGDGCLASLRDITERTAAEEALRDSEERFRALIENSSDIIFVIDADGDLLYASPAGSSVTGFEPGTMIGTSGLDLVHPDDLPDVRAAFAATVSSTGVGPRTTFRVRHASGTWRWMEAIANNRLEEPSIHGLVVNARDVTEKIDAAVALDGVNRVLRTLTAADTAVVHATDEGALFDALCQLIVETGGYPRAWIAVLDPSHPSGIVPVANRGGDDRFFADVIEASGGAPAGPVSEAALLGQTRVVQDIGGLPEDLPVWQVTLDNGYRSLIALPLRVEGDVIGVLAIYANEPNAFDVEEINLLERLAADLAYGVTSLRTRTERQGYFDQLERSLDAMVETIVTTLEYRDPYTAGHQRRVAQLAALIGHELGLGSDAIAGIKMAANIHDIGKISVPAEILSKPGRLTAAEFELVKQHARAGYEIVKGIDFRWPVPEMILQHHERIDGSGYPSGLVGREIVLGARIIAVADTVEAMCSHRPYRPGRGVAAMLREIEDQRGTLFDAEIVDACLRVFQGGRFSFETS